MKGWGKKSSGSKCISSLSLLNHLIHAMKPRKSKKSTNRLSSDACSLTQHANPTLRKLRDKHRTQPGLDRANKGQSEGILRVMDLRSSTNMAGGSSSLNPDRFGSVLCA